MTVMSVLRNLKFAARSLRKTPLITIAAVAALALGIGSTTAIFSIVYGVLLRPLPFPDSDRIVNLWEVLSILPKVVVAPANYYDWRAGNRVFSAMAAYQDAVFNLDVPGNEPERYTGAACEPDFFDVLRVSPVLGRSFTAEETQPGHDGVVILSYTLWRLRFGGDPNVLGRNLNLNGRNRTVIGVMPENFQYPVAGSMWAPLAPTPQNRARRDLHQFRVIARLKDGVSIERARSEYNGIVARLDAEYPDFNKGSGILIERMLDDSVKQVRPALLVLLGAVGFVLLIACANVANLLLAKAAGRRREIATRISLGATRGRILGQMLVEGVLLAAVGGAVGLLCGVAAFRALIKLAPANIPRLNQVGLDWRVAGFAAILSLITGLLFGSAPAWYAARVDVNSMLKEGSRGSGSRSRFRSTLVVAQVATALILLAGAGLLARSFYELAHVDPGFDPRHLLTLRLAPAPVKYLGKPELQIELARGILRRAAALPGVRSTAISSNVPLLGNPIYIARFEGRPPVAPSQAPLVNYFSVTPSFFETMGMRIVRGRPIAGTDTAGRPPVVVVNQTLVDLYFPGQDPIGKRMEVGFATPPNWREIVGVVADVKTAGLDQSTPVQVYAAYYQQPSFPEGFVSAITVLARTAQDPGAMGAAVKNAILETDKAQPVYDVQPMTVVVSQSIAERRLAMILLAFFACSALSLAALGLYGVMSYSVTMRRSEIGIRMALGARQAQVLAHIQRQGMMLALGGVMIGIVGAYLLTRLMASLLFHVDARDPLIFTLVALLLLGIALLACYLPARRASRVDPIVALRYE